jgi:N-acetylmuramoyl-L-alanine amidase
MIKRAKDNLDTCKNNPEEFTGFAVSKLNKNFCLRLLANITLIFVIFFCGSFFPPRSKPYGLTKVVIDAGHGGHDSGCLGKKTKEKDVALGISLKLGRFIEENYPDVKVIYTRSSDKFIGLKERAEVANNAKADLFICIHCNSACTFDRKKKKEICNSEIEGVESWVMGLNKSEANLEVSKRENEVILMEKDYTSQYDGFDPNSPEANIIFSLYQNTYLEQSLRMATLVQQEVKSKNRAGRGVKQAGFLVLYKTFMPSILIETGFLSNEKEEKFLGSEKGQEEIASSIFKAFQQYKGSMESGRQDNDEKAAPKSQAKTDPRPEKATNSESEKTDKPEEKIDRPNEKTIEVPVEKSVEKPADKPETKPVDKSQPKPAEVAVTKNSSVKDTASNSHAEDAKRQDADNVLQWSVQFYTSPKPIADNHKVYKSFDDVREEFENNMYKYSTGLVKTKEEAIAMQSKIRGMGYKDAFVVAFFNNKKISIKEASEISKKKTN